MIQFDEQIFSSGFVQPPTSFSLEKKSDCWLNLAKQYLTAMTAMTRNGFVSTTMNLFSGFPLGRFPFRVSLELWTWDVLQNPIK